MVDPPLPQVGKPFRLRRAELSALDRDSEHAGGVLAERCGSSVEEHADDVVIGVVQVAQIDVPGVHSSSASPAQSQPPSRTHTRALRLACAPDQHRRATDSADDPRILASRVTDAFAHPTRARVYRARSTKRPRRIAVSDKHISSFLVQAGVSSASSCSIRARSCCAPRRSKPDRAARSSISADSESPAARRALARRACARAIS